ncbi:MAG: hypothetical protein IT326_07125, partial [Anaerolineae bacterium]|nr:hypothetical protein [Anaerolineae bacterium]
SGEFTKFAPVGSSNVQSLGTVPVGSSISASQALVVNVSTEPGAYPLKVSFTYTNPEGKQFTDDQVVTLLVYSSVQLEASFYRDPGPVFEGQPVMLPVQITNLGRKTIVLGDVTINAEGSTLLNNSALIGALDAGGFFTIDPELTAGGPGPLEVFIAISYTDDFNQPQVISQSLTIEVQAVEIPEPGPETVIEDTSPETFLQKIWRFIRGLFGLDSAPPDARPSESPGNGESESQPVPAPSGGGGGGGG